MLTSRSTIRTALAVSALACAVVVPGAQARPATDPAVPAVASVTAPARVDGMGIQPSIAHANVAEHKSQPSPTTGGSGFDWTYAAIGIAALFALGLLALLAHRILPLGQPAAGVGVVGRLRN
jgi:hypothetical protein